MKAISIMMGGVRYVKDEKGRHLRPAKQQHKQLPDMRLCKNSSCRRSFRPYPPTSRHGREQDYCCNHCNEIVKKREKIAAVIAIAALFVFGFFGGAFPQTVVQPVASTPPTSGSADDPAIWIHPTQPERSVVIGMSKSGGVYVYNLQGQQLQHLPQGTAVNNIDVRQNVILSSQTVDVVACNLRDAGKLAVFVVNSGVLTQITDRHSSGNNIQNDSYGFTLYRHSDGTLYVFERPKGGGKVRQYMVGANGITIVVRDLNYTGGTAEGFAADDDLGYVYITEEGGGIHKYLADPGASADRLAFFAQNDGISGDREGLALYACADGDGYLLLSSQGNSQIKIYERGVGNAFLKTVIAADHNGNTGLGTDGLDVTNASLGSLFPRGLVVVHDNGGSRYHFYHWPDFAASDLRICANGGSLPEIPEAPSGMTVEVVK